MKSVKASSNRQKYQAMGDVRYPLLDTGVWFCRILDPKQTALLLSIEMSTYGACWLKRIMYNISCKISSFNKDQKDFPVPESTKALYKSTGIMGTRNCLALIKQNWYKQYFVQFTLDA